MPHSAQLNKSTHGSLLGLSATCSPTQRSDIGEAGVQKIDLVQEVVNHLRDQIIAGQFEPNGLMPAERELCETFSVSRTVIREAMRVLRAQGLVEVSQGRVPRVRRADPQHVVESFGTFLQRKDHSLFDLLEVRRPLETAIAELAAQRATPPQINEMAEAIKQQAKASTLKEQIDTDIRFHSLLAETADNPIFGLLLTTLVGLMHKSRQETLTHVGSKRALAGHREVLSAIRHADVRAARKAMLGHLAMAEEDLRREST